MTYIVHLLTLPFRRLPAILSDRVALTAMAARIVQALGWLAAIPLITTRLTQAEQGFYYTFASMAALQVFVELGMTGVIVQSVAHEVAHLRLEGVGAASRWYGPVNHRARLASILRFSGWWFGLAGAIAAVVLAGGGFSFLTVAERSHATGVDWVGPWLAIALLTCGVVWTAGVMATLEGIGAIKTATVVRLVASLSGLLGLILGLYCGAGLWSVPISLALVATISLSAGWRSLRRSLLAVRCEDPDPSYSWRIEIWPFQWRIAVSWMAGWFIFQAMTPAMLRVSGPEAAGRFGLALQLANGVQAIAGVWTQVRAPAWGMMIARREWVALDRDFRRWTMISLGFGLLGALIVIAVIELIVRNYGMLGRLPSYIVLLPLLGVAVMNQWVFAAAGYLRAHRKEPFLGISVAGALAMIIILQFEFIINESFLPKVYGIVSLLVGGLAGTVVWLRCRSAWHGVVQE